MSEAARNTRQVGSAFEGVACAFLEAQGLNIIEKNFHRRFAEIDIIAKDKDMLCFIEVRSRKDSRYGGPAETVNLAKQGKIIRAASAYLQKLCPPIPMCRFDVVAIEGALDRPKITYFKNAFGLDTPRTGRGRGGPWQVY